MNIALHEAAYAHALQSINGFGARRLALIHSRFGSFRNAWNASGEDFAHADIPSTLCDAFTAHKRAWDVEARYAALTQNAISCCLFTDSGYPPLLKEIPDFPVLLYMRGALPPPSLLHLGIVGTRRASPYGKEMTVRLVSQLAAVPAAVVSGLARGIDGIAHRASLECRLPTIAVLGSGIDDPSIYPRAHLPLAHDILSAGGAVLSEFPPGTPAEKSHFPMRNRIIAGLSHGVLVTEAPEKSGSMITASLALEYNRDIFAVPGPVHAPNSAGPHLLIRQGAKLITHTRDIVEEFPEFALPEAVSASPLAVSEEEMKIIELLSSGALHVDVLAETLDMPVSSLQALLTTMELAGKIAHLDRGIYMKK